MSTATDPVPRRVYMAPDERNCLRAAVASLLDLSLDEIPAELDAAPEDCDVAAFRAMTSSEHRRRSTEFWGRWAAWAQERGLVLCLHGRSAPTDRPLWIGIAQERDELPAIHAVVMHEWQPLHDPDPNRSAARDDLGDKPAYKIGIGITLDPEYIDGERVEPLITADAPIPAGTWTGAGDADPFLQDVTNLWTQRTANSDADVVTGHYARLGTGVESNVAVQADVKATFGSLSAGQESRLGVFARYVDTSNWLMAVVRIFILNGGRWQVALYKRVAGTTTLLAATNDALLASGDYDWRTIKLTADTAGNVNVYEAAQGAELGAAKLTVFGDANLATGGAIDDGGYGIYDANTSTAGTNTRLVDNFTVLTSTVDDAAIFASQSLEIRHDRVVREDSGGTLWVKPSKYEGDYLRVPPAGAEDRQVRWIVKASRGDPATSTDDGIDNISARLYYTPRYLIVPEP